MLAFKQGLLEAKKKLSVLIVEDSISYGIELERLCNDVGFEVLSVVEGSAEALDIIFAESPDMILMDIDIKGKLSGIEIGKSIVHLDIPILYITSFNDQETVRKANESNMVDYLVKPVSKERLIEAFQHIVKSEFDVKEDGDVQILSRPKDRKILFFQKNGEYVKIKVDEVVYVESDDNYCRFYLSDKSYYLMRIKISEVEDKLYKHGFLRCHRRFVVNTKIIKKIDAKTFKIALVNEMVLPFSRSKKEKIYNYIELLNR